MNSMVECQWDSVVLSPYSPVLAGLELTFMCLTRSNFSLFSTPGFVVAPSDLSMSSLWSLIFVYAGILLAVRSAPQIS